MAWTVDPVVVAGAMADTQQPTLTVDDELTLRPWTAGPADVSAVHAAFRDPDIQHWHGFRIDDHSEAIAWIEHALANWREEQSANWAIVDGQTDEPLGRVALHMNLRRGHCEVAYWVLRDARRRDIATRAAITATAWAHDLGFHRVDLQHSTQNAASCRVATKAGFIAEGTRRGQDLHVDGWHDMHQHSHLATD